MSDSMVLKNYQVVYTNYSTYESRTIRTTGYDMKRMWEHYPTASAIYCDGPVSEENPRYYHQNRYGDVV